MEGRVKMKAEWMSTSEVAKNIKLPVARYYMPEKGVYFRELGLDGFGCSQPKTFQRNGRLGRKGRRCPKT